MKIISNKFTELESRTASAKGGSDICSSRMTSDKTAMDALPSMGGKLHDDSETDPFLVSAFITLFFPSFMCFVFIGIFS